MAVHVKMRFKKYIKWVLAVLIVLFGLLQLVQPERTNPPIQSDFLTVTKAPAQVVTMFNAACYDCHSNATRWPWYSYVAPMSWQIAQDVSHGRKHVNLSEWPATPDLARKKIEDMSDEIDDGDMPLGKYTMIHKDARLTADQRSELTQWLDGQAAALKAQAGAK